jgi:hypothetical protein
LIQSRLLTSERKEGKATGLCEPFSPFFSQNIQGSLFASIKNSGSGGGIIHIPSLLKKRGDGKKNTGILRHFFCIHSFLPLASPIHVIKLFVDLSTYFLHVDFYFFVNVKVNCHRVV